MKKRLAQLDFSGGVNTKDDPRDAGPTTCQVLENLYPGRTPPPREGCTRWAAGAFPDWFGTVYELIDWKDARGDKVIAWTSEGFEWMDRASGLHVIAYNYSKPTVAYETGPRVGYKICWTRIEGSLIVGSDDPNWKPIIMEWSQASQEFEIRYANIELPPPMYLEVVPVAGPGPLQGGKWYSYAWTLVNRGQDRGVTVKSGFVPGKLESWENLEKRVTVFLPEGFNKFQIRFKGIPAEYDQQARHIRVYRTQPQDSEEEARGFTPGWLMDVAYTQGPTTIIETDDVVGTEVDQSPVTSGYNDLPACRSMVYNAGRLWINGAFGGSPGRWWYSSGVQNAVGYLKHLTLFALNTDFKDCSLDDAQQATGAAVISGDIYFFNERSIFRLDDGSVLGTPRVVSTNIGCPFPRTITPGPTWVYFLSARGPYMVQGGAVDPLKWILAGELWPNSKEGGSLLKKGPEEVIAFWYKSVWWIASGSVVIGFMEDPASQRRGSFHVVFGDPTMRLDRVAVLSEDVAVIAGGTDLRPIWFLRSDAYTDMGYFYTIKVTGHRMFVDPTDPSIKGEPWDVRVHAMFTDKGQMKTRLAGDVARFRKVFTWVSRGLSSLLQPQDAAPAMLTTHQQAIPARLHASFFDVTVEKVYRAPFDFTLSGLEVRYIPRRSRPQDSVSIQLGTDEPLDGDLLLTDVGENVTRP